MSDLLTRPGVNYMKMNYVLLRKGIYDQVLLRTDLICLVS